MPSSQLPATERTLADFVREDSRRATVFEHFGLDFCCHGFHTLEEAAVKKGLDVKDVLAALEQIGADGTSKAVADEWNDLDVLVQHIVQRHHGYVRMVSPTVSAWLDKLVAKHGERHGELTDVRAAFSALQDELLMHMRKEENVLFPFITDLAVAARNHVPAPAGPFGALQNPIRVMEDDHESAGQLVDRIKDLTSDYTPPADACATYRACYGELARFARDLHRHIHLENNILFPAAMELEARLT